MDEASDKLRVHLVGEIDHPDFREAVSLVRHESHSAGADGSPELIVLAQSRPDVIGLAEVERLRHTVPLAGMVGLLGSWCEGEARTGRPWPGVQRFYSYEFVPWWRKQMRLRGAQCCPDWVRTQRPITRHLVPGHPQSRSGLVVIRSHERENAGALADLLHKAGHSTLWQHSRRNYASLRGAVAGIWDGGQLNDTEAADLASFCAQMTRDHARVVALLDFPRRDRIDRAYEAGAATVLGKPWFNEDVLTVVDSIATSLLYRRAA